MKLAFCLFMSLYVLLLSVLPCADSHSLQRQRNEPARIVADQHTHEDDQPTADQCSPFCSCACCGIALDQPPVFAFTFTEPQPVVQSVPTLTPSPLPLVALPTWQPPQQS